MSMCVCISSSFCCNGEGTVVTLCYKFYFFWTHMGWCMCKNGRTDIAFIRLASLISPEDATGKEIVETALKGVKKPELQNVTDVC